MVDLDDVAVGARLLVGEDLARSQRGLHGDVVGPERSSHSPLGRSMSASGQPSNIWKSTVGSSRGPSGRTWAMASWNNGDFMGSPIRCNQTPSPDSNRVAPVCALGMPISSDGDGCSTCRQCITVGTSAPWAMLVCAGPACPVRSPRSGGP